MCFVICILLGMFLINLVIWCIRGWNLGCKNVEFLGNVFFLWIWMLICCFKFFILMVFCLIFLDSVFLMFFVMVFICFDIVCVCCCCILDWVFWLFCIEVFVDWLLVSWLELCWLLFVWFDLFFWNFKVCWVILMVCCMIILIGVGFGWLGWNFWVIILVFLGIFFIFKWFCILKVNFIELVICLNFSMFIFENESKSMKKYISSDIKFVNVFSYVGKLGGGYLYCCLLFIVGFVIFY